MFKGIITPIVTPFDRDLNQSINYEATEQLIDHLIDKGVKGIFILGSNGEFHVIDHQEKIAFAEKVVKIVDHRVPVFAGTGDCSTKEAIVLSKEMERAGVDALSVITPYFIKPSNEELYGYYEMIAENVNIPIILYNIPKNTGCNLSPEVVEKLADIDNICGIKDSSGDMENLQAYIEKTKEKNFDVLVGSDSKISEGFKLGAKGAIAGTSNVITEVLVDLFSALQTENDEKAKSLQKSIDVLRKILKLGTVPSILKRSVELAGIASVGPARKPVNETTKEVDGEIGKVLEYYKLI